MFEKPSHTCITLCCKISPKETSWAQQHFDKKMSQSELAASYAALILADDDLDITVRKFPLVNANMLTAV